MVSALNMHLHYANTHKTLGLAIKPADTYGKSIFLFVYFLQLHTCVHAHMYQDCSESCASYFMMLTHEVEPSL